MDPKPIQINMRFSNAFTRLRLKTVKPVVSIMAAGIDFTVPADGSNPERNTELIHRGDGSRTAALASHGGWEQAACSPTRCQLVGDQVTSHVQACSSDIICEQ